MKERYTLNELLEDITFQKYATQAESPEAKRWKAWLTAHPDHDELAEQARMMIIGLHFNKEQLSDDEIEQAWYNVEDRIKRDSNAHLLEPWRIFQLIAASITLLLIAAASWWVLDLSYLIDIQTEYGETKSLKLPDGSNVTLNANSTLSYDVRNMQSPERIVALSGEAFFQVVHHTDGTDQSTFSVVTEEGGRIEVLGTAFNVQSRRDITQVVLESGKVAFRTLKEATTMKPGEMLEYTLSTNKVSKKNVQAEIYSAWKDQKLYFDDTPLTSLAIILEDTYGLKTIFKDELLKNKKISGAVTSKNLNTLLQAVERLLNISIQMEQDTLYFESIEL